MLGEAKNLESCLVQKQEVQMWEPVTQLSMKPKVLFGVCSGRLKKLQCAVPGDGSGPGTATQEEWSVHLLPESLF